MLSSARRSVEFSKVGHELTKKMEQYRRGILERLIRVFTFLCHRGLAISGDDEIIGLVRNGNYLGMLELFSDYDDFFNT